MPKPNGKEREGLKSSLKRLSRFRYVKTAPKLPSSNPRSMKTIDPHVGILAGNCCWQSKHRKSLEKAMEFLGLTRVRFVLSQLMHFTFLVIVFVIPRIRKTENPNDQFLRLDRSRCDKD